jgi:hypothetical protein
MHPVQRLRCSAVMLSCDAPAVMSLLQVLVGKRDWVVQQLRGSRGGSSSTAPPEEQQRRA